MSTPCLLALLALCCWHIPVLAEGDFRCASFFQEGPPPLAAAKPAQRTVAGTRQALVLFARFKGESTAVPSWAGEIFNPERPGSFSHFYDTMSFGQLRVRGEVAPRVYESSQPASAYLADNPSEHGQFGYFSLGILRQADVDIDFARFDNDGPDGIPNSGDDDGVVDAVFLVLEHIPADFLLSEATGIARLGFEKSFITSDAGTGGNSIQILAGQGTIQQGRFFAEAVGSMCHEYGHVLGLPDLYDMDYRKPAEDSAGVGAWCLMGWGALGWHGNDGPNSFCAWSRARLGWSLLIQTTQEQQEMRLEPVGRGGAIFQIPLQQDEYFLLEHRQREGNYYDRHIPGEGLLIWHVREKQKLFFRREDSSGVDSLSTTLVDLECADGQWQEAGFPLGEEPDPQQGEDNLDFWAHDTGYTRMHGGNLGDATDPFDGERYTAFTPQTNPAAYSTDGRLSVRIEGIRFADGLALAQVHAQVPLIRVEAIFLADTDGDSVLRAGEEVQVSFTLRHEGSFAAQAVRVQLHSSDPWVEVLQSEVLFGDLAVGGMRRYYREENLRWRFARGLMNSHTADLSLKVYVGERLAGEQGFTVTGVPPRVRVLAGSLEQGFPNPFNLQTTIRFNLAQRGDVELAIYNLLGQRVATLVLGEQEAGSHEVRWEGRDETRRELASGVYLCRLQAGAQVETRRLLLLR